MLSDRHIKHALTQGELGISPFRDEHLQPASVDLTLDREFRVPLWGIDQIDVANVPAEHTEVHRVDNQGMVLEPGDFVLGCTREVVNLSRGTLVGRVEGKSSLGRLGLLVHVTAGFVDPGFVGQITLELFNAAPWEIVLYPNMRIAQIAFSRLSSAPDRLYGAAGNHYQGQRGPVASRYQHEVASTEKKETVTP